LILNITIKWVSGNAAGRNFEGIHMLDTIIVVAIVAIAAFFVGRRIMRSFTSGQSTCGCGGCGQSGSCGGSGGSQDKNNCCGSR
jgi:hypothetical protein